MRCRVAIVVGVDAVAGVRVVAVVPPMYEAVHGFFVAIGVGGKHRTVGTKVEGGRVVVVAVIVIAITVAVVQIIAADTTSAGVVPVVASGVVVVMVVANVVAADASVAVIAVVVPAPVPSTAVIL